jgi:hypothetical protein
MTHYLRFPDQETWLIAATAAGYRVNQSEVFNYYTHDWAIDDVGIIYNNDGEVITPPTQMDGWHVNIIGELPQEFNEYLVNPSSPYRVFA